MKISRNALCPCGSGKKYKHCHWGKPLPGEDTVGIAEEARSSSNKKVALLLLVLGVAVGVGVGIWQKKVVTGMAVGAAWFLASIAYMSFRNPPPPNENPGDPAALNFGRPADKK